MPGTVRIDLGTAFPEGKKAMFGLDAVVAGSGLDPTLAELIKIRASQLNGCAFCLDVHTKDARAAGETEQRIYALDAWRETPFYTDGERAVLALTEELTVRRGRDLPDEVVDEVRALLGEEMLGRVLLAIVVINAWNLLGVTQRRPVGDYRAPARRSPAVPSSTASPGRESRPGPGGIPVPPGHGPHDAPLPPHDTRTTSGLGDRPT